MINFNDAPKTNKNSFNFLSVFRLAVSPMVEKAHGLFFYCGMSLGSLFDVGFSEVNAASKKYV